MATAPERLLTITRRGWVTRLTAIAARLRRGETASVITPEEYDALAELLEVDEHNRDALLSLAAQGMVLVRLMKAGRPIPAEVSRSSEELFAAAAALALPARSFDMVPVESSNIAAVGWLADLLSGAVAGVLRVQFKNGTTYDYGNVTLFMFESLLTAPSKGKFLQHLKAHPTDHPARKVEPGQ